MVISMSGVRPVLSFAGMAVLILGISAPAFASGVYTTYQFNGPNTIDASTCGSTGTVQGCFTGASLNGLTGACAFLEGPATTNGNTTTQQLFVLQTGSDAAPVVALRIY